MKEDELNDLKYRQLQKLAKEHGIKANMPKSALIEALLKSSEETEKEDQSMEEQLRSSDSDVDSQTNDSVDSSNDHEKSSLNSSKSKRKSSLAQETSKLEVNNEDSEKSIDNSKRQSRRKSSLQEASKPELNESSLDNSKRQSRRKSSSCKPEANEDSKIDSFDKSSLNVSRRNSRISRLFDKEAFEIEAGKVSRFAEKILNSPRKRSSILNLTPLAKGQTIDSPLVSKTNTPLQKRPSMTQKTTEIKKKKQVTMKSNTPGSISKAKDRVTTTGIPRIKKVPDFAKLHAKQFGKMDTLDQYLDKKKERMAALTPGPKTKTKSAISPSKKPVTEVSKTSFNFSNASSSKKPFVFKANKNTPSKALDNITNKSKYKPYTGKLKPWNAKDSLKNRQQQVKAPTMAKVKEQQMSIIKGVRMNKRMELMMKKRAMEN